jgi:protein-glutamine gamma-glutamyltransferase
VLAQAALFFRDGGLRYTLSPPLLGMHSVDEFLFETRSGFCEHFASAFVVLMRAAGVPARVVTGYQGGEVNPVDGHLLVRQSDAHAWAEVWMPERGWMRVDPTAMAVPIRIEQGLARAVPSGDALPLLMRESFAWLAGLRHNWDAMTYTWNEWILGYSQERQHEALSRLGLASRPGLVRWSILFGALAAILAWQVLRMTHQRPAQDPAHRLWLRWCQRLARRGLRRAPHEDACAFAARIGRRYPAWAAEAGAIAQGYLALRYGRGPAERERIRALHHQIRRFRPR